MPKNIALFIDGTWNEPAEKELTKNTNVHKLFEDADGQPGQECHYLNGIGTDPGPGWWPKKYKKFALRNIAAGVGGLGVSDRIKSAYKFLSREYTRGDHVYLFGFSRGAFAARSVAGFVDAVGLLLEPVADDENLIELAYALYENDDNSDHPALRQYLRELEFDERPSSERDTDLPIYFIGAWDTVATIGLPRRLARFSARFTEYHQTELPSNVSFARHALALHEMRADFPALLWHDERHREASPPLNAPPRLQQMWFPGAHANVGSGYPSSDWSDVAMDWMAGEAKSLGLRLRQWPRGAAPGLPGTRIENSLSGFFALLPREMRTAVRVPHLVDRVTSTTFDMHPLAIERLFDDGHATYRFRGSLNRARRVNDALSAVDWCSIRMLDVLALARRGDSASQSLKRAVCGTPRNHADCRAALTAFVQKDGKMTPRDLAAFLRAFILSIESCNRQTGMLADVESAVQKRISELRTTLDLTKHRACATRLQDVASHIRDYAGELPGEWRDPLDGFADHVASIGQSLRAAIDREVLHRKLPRRPLLRPKDRAGYGR